MEQREEFRSSRVRSMEQVSASLLRVVDDALADGRTGEDFARAVQDAIETAWHEQYGTAQEQYAAASDPAQAWKWAWKRIRPGLDAATATADPRKIANWLGTAIVNSARVAGSRSDRHKMWLSRRDDKVRPFHIEADGQIVAWGESFTVCDGRKMDFPGQPVGSPDCWINCRCVAMPTKPAMTAAVDPNSTGNVIVAIPAADDPIWGVSSEPKPHMTLIWLGDQAITDLIREAVAVAAAQMPPTRASVTSREALGDDSADVVMLDPDAIGPAREQMMSDPNVRAAHDAVEQYPQWTPHTTLGYPDNPATGEPNGSIQFDRLAVWDGEYAGEEYPMTAIAPEETIAEDPAVEVEPEAAPPETSAEADTVPWYGVLAPEGIASGDGRRFTAGALEWRELPIPLLWQEKSGMGHEGSVVIGQIANIWKEGNLVWASGHFAQTDAADQVIGLLAEGHLRGVSIDVDSAEMAMEDEEAEMIDFTKGRISAATVVPIPAFAEAYISLGVRVAHDEEPEVETQIGSTGAYNIPLPFVSEAPWDGSASRFTPQQWKASCCLHLAPEVEPKSNHKLPIKEPDGALSRAGTHAAAARVNQVDAPTDKKAAAKSTLRGAYKQLSEEPPDVLKGSAAPSKTCGCRGCDAFDCGEEACSCCWTVNDSDVWTYAPEHPILDPDLVASIAFDRGPGWVTDPVATKRIHDYWTTPGHEGYAKIAWGTPGDFRRLRAYLSKYIGPRFLNRTTAQWHHDALGYWPAEKGLPGNPPYSGELAPALTLVAAGGWCAPSDWFADPQLEGPTPLTVSEDGRVLGHLATWDTCHIGIPGACTTAPHSASGYAYFRTGVVSTDNGDISVGQITMSTGHAPLNAGANAAAAHYDNTGTVVADIVVGDDDYGIWIAGACRPGITDMQRQALRAGALSGDWRSIRGALELVAALVVNVPGFPIPRTSLAASGIRQESLVAAGVVLPQTNKELPDLIQKAVESYMLRSKRAEAVLVQMRRFRVEQLMADLEV